MVEQEQGTYLISNVEVWTPGQVLDHQDVLVSGGILKGLHRHQSAGDAANSTQLRHVDGRGKVLLPAGVDPQVHLRVPGQTEKETPASALASALKGGFAAVLNMPNTRPTVDNARVVAQARAELAPAEDKTGVLVGLSGAMTVSLRGQDPTNMVALVDAGVWALTDDGFGVVDDGIMEQAFRVSSDSGVPILQHAEFPGHGGVLAPGPVQERLGIRSYPDGPEYEMVVRDIELLRRHPGARYHVLHVSSRKTLDVVRRARDEGLRVSCEVSPHHLHFSSDDIDPSNTAFKMNPPLRSRADRDELRRALASGDCDFVATDHAPHESGVKGSKFSTSAFGTTGLETSLQVLLGLKAQGLLSATRLVQVFAQRPAAFLGLDGFGDFNIGQPFRGVLVDPAQSVIVDETHLVSQSKNSCFLGATLPGQLLWTFIGEKSWSLTRGAAPIEQ